MEEIKVGEYGRTNKGKILIFVWVENEKYILVKTRNEKQNNDILNFDKYYLDKDEHIIKHSKNIIDLIEVGDYVNGNYVKECKNGYIMVGNGLDGFQLWERNIQSIVTKEQFESMEYRLGE